MVDYELFYFQDKMITLSIVCKKKCANITFNTMHVQIHNFKG